MAYVTYGRNPSNPQRPRATVQGYSRSMRTWRINLTRALERWHMARFQPKQAARTARDGHSAEALGRARDGAGRFPAGGGL